MILPDFLSKKTYQKPSNWTGRRKLPAYYLPDIQASSFRYAPSTLPNSADGDLSRPIEPVLKEKPKERFEFFGSFQKTRPFVNPTHYRLILKNLGSIYFTRRPFKGERWPLKLTFKTSTTSIEPEACNRKCTKTTSPQENLLFMGRCFKDCRQ